ncbi:MAG: CoA transferase [Bifidobacteriaceae bacterium]|jgi:benzylsuccinate CoA-transferase BbsE subunit|nr:CoA transferase [Bifidobacteriaceae bacterium]
MVGPLNDIRVLEFDDTPSALASLAGKLLADLGADVIKIEPPQGDPMRRVGPFVADTPNPDKSLTFWHYHTNKRSVAAVRELPGGRQFVLDLAATVGIVLDGTKDGLDQTGAGYEAIKQRNPEVIYIRLSPFGSSGPWQHYEASDAVLLALSGITAVTGYDIDLELDPVAPTGGQARHLTGIYGALAALGALAYRDQTGHGQFADVAAHDVITVSSELSLPYWEFRREAVHRQTSRHARPDPHTPKQTVRCRDGKYLVALTLYLFDAVRFPALVQWLDAAGMAEDLTSEEYADNQVRHDRVDHIVEVVGRFCAAHDSDYLFHEAQRRRLPWSPLYSPAELLDNPHLRARGAIAEIHHEDLGRPVRYPGAPYILSATPWTLRSPAPGLGQHTTELLEELGYTPEDITRLHEEGTL